MTEAVTEAGMTATAEILLARTYSVNNSFRFIFHVQTCGPAYSKCFGGLHSCNLLLNPLLSPHLVLGWTPKLVGIALWGAIAFWRMVGNFPSNLDTAA